MKSTKCIIWARIFILALIMWTGVAAPLHAAGSKQKVVPTCHLKGGQARFSKGWRRFSPVDVRFSSSSVLTFALSSATSAERLALRVWRKDQSLLFCPVINGPPDRRVACLQLYILDEDWKAGIQRTFDISGVVEGAVLRCRFSK